MDPYEFVDESNRQDATNFNDSFLAIFSQDSSDEEFEGFDSRDIHLGKRVEDFHTREDYLADKENRPPSTNPRKRTSKPESWKRNVVKTSKACGLEYINHRGRFVQKRETGPGCGCTMQCTEQFDEEQKAFILKRFNDMGNTNCQNLYLKGMIVKRDIQRVGSQGRGGKRTDHNLSIKRSAMFDYFVCDENSTRIKDLPFDGRGKSANSRVNKFSDETINKIKQHIQSFPTEISHYSRDDNPNKKYLSADLSINRMYMLYLEKEEPQVWKRQQERVIAKQQNVAMPQEFKPIVSETSYRLIFNTQFNLGFGRPRTDTCSKCDELNISGDTILLQEHHKRAEEGYASKRSDKEHSCKTWSSLTLASSCEIEHCSVDAVDMITYDFQQNLPTPTLTHNDMFYQRQLWTYNFGIHDCVTEQGHMYMWDETVAARGSSEVSSCLWHYVKNNRTGAKSLISYSDGCSGQNKNITIIGFYNELIRNGVYSTIDHKFLTRGHTFLPNDTDFAQIEKRKRSAVVHLPEDWAKVVEEANRRKPFKVQRMQQDQFLSFKNSYKQVYKHKRKTTTKQDFKFREVHWMNFGWGADTDKDGNITMVHHPDEVWMRYGYSKEESWKKVKLWNGQEPEDPRRLYQCPVKIKKAKEADLKKMAEKHLPPEKRDFYMNLNTGDLEDASDSEDDEEWE
ncbi:hypothetical protein AC249_AIPGENE28589 [Exaiptasia diaphana]|nr:hypothetical protein AC249_AIPGENE28589 [Exaiptasia diaphana]